MLLQKDRRLPNGMFSVAYDSGTLAAGDYLPRFCLARLCFRGLGPAEDSGVVPARASPSGSSGSRRRERSKNIRGFL
jgi:hypothetical protein